MSGFDLSGQTISLSAYTLHVSSAFPDSSQSTYYHCTSSTGQKLLLKVLNFSENSDLVDVFDNEVMCLYQIGECGNVLELKAQQKGKVGVGCGVMLFGEEIVGSLEGEIRRKRVGEERKVAEIVKGIASGLKVIHGKGFAHRDLRTDTVFLDAHFTPKIAEFGLCTSHYSAPLPVHSTPHLLAPEQLPGSPQPLTQSIDYWALGCIAYQLLLGEAPFDSANPQDQLSGRYKQPVRSIPDIWHALFTGLFTVDPRVRLNANKVIDLLDAFLTPRMAVLPPSKPSKLANLFKTSTSSWVKAATSPSNGPLVSIFVQKLLQKAWSKPHKIPKFYLSMCKRPLDNTLICIKCLLLLHQYCSQGPDTAVQVEYIGNMLDIVEKYWGIGRKAGKMDEWRTEYIAGLIRTYVRVIREKLQVNKLTRTSFNWVNSRINSLSDYQLLLRLWENVGELGGKLKSTGPLEGLRLAWLEEVTVEMTEITKVLLKALAGIAVDPGNRSVIQSVCIAVQQGYDRQRSLTAYLRAKISTSRVRPVSENTPVELARVIALHPGVKIDLETPRDDSFDEPRRSRAITQPFTPAPDLLTPEEVESPVPMRQRAITEAADSAQHLQSNRVPSPEEDCEVYSLLPSEESKNGGVDESLWKVSLSELQFKEVVGEGSSCIVYRGIYKKTQVAIKVIKTSVTAHPGKEFDREVGAMIRLRHPNLVLFMGVCTEKQQIIVSEFCAGGTLFRLLHDRKDVEISFKQQIKMIKDIAQGMHYLHSKSPPIIHRDLKTLNLLLAETVNGPNDNVLLKLTDFGVAKTMGEGQMTGQMGTCHWMAPEVLGSKPYGLPADVYSFGVVIWEILTRQTPYKGLTTPQIINAVLIRNDRPNTSLIPASTHPSLRQIMTQCWHKTPSMRPTFSDILDELESIS